MLEERDAELERYDTGSALMAATLADRDRQLAEMQAAYAQAHSGGGGASRVGRGGAGEDDWVGGS